MLHKLGIIGECTQCGEYLHEGDETWETKDQFLCPDCFFDTLEEVEGDGQPDEAQEWADYDPDC